MAAAAPPRASHRAVSCAGQPSCTIVTHVARGGQQPRATCCATPAILPCLAQPACGSVPHAVRWQRPPSSGDVFGSAPMAFVF
ncbi:Zinc finger, RING/FYVE/PHD-type domain containing protein [Dorcoceras hygrometricum]|uniref:Zinc finger, RING/FYVE/PHD-type domain containing protein n=1 Tax=Dorcoceras hygrometricum TaxID=472368 RepID=A0A2Z6ZR95_9LAMI|nr:Zinc finger, RING/FYVE/PHD-type domain containing protein [Dorcoceras hygrometricum]